MSRAVIRFLDDYDGSVRFCLQASGSKLSRLPCKPNEKPFLFDDPPMVAEAGEVLRDSLLAHEDISGRLSTWLKMLDKDFLSLQLHMESSVADQLPWEALVDLNRSFIALDKKSPMTRVLPADQQDTVQREFPFIPPLRLACVLGAWWEDGGLQEQRAEWESIKAGLAAAADLMPVTVCVYSCAADLEAEVLANPPAGLTIHWKTITGNAQALLADIAAFTPHILHLYAHGSSGDQQYLSVSTAADVAQGSAHGSVLLTAKDIRQSADRDQYIWAIALNCCDSASNTVDGRHFAWQLIKFGFPAVIAMREPVKTSEARIVSRYFYEGALRSLHEIPVGARKNVEWAGFLQRVRLELAGGDSVKAAQSKRWLIPVLYARTDPFQIFRCKPDIDHAERIRLRAEREEIVRHRDTTLQTVPPELKEQIGKVFDLKIAEIDAQLL